ncbi:VRR-NUC domain-containing protein [Cyathus striatus]|nr:VRR-NUC domain-containing protein [Cyathus striatus]
MDETNNSRLIQQLIFGGRLDNRDVEKEFEEQDKETKSSRYGIDGCKKPSAYVERLEEMINVISAHESHLLTPTEWTVIEHFKSFSYNTRYCLARLVLRKPNTWHALSAFKEKYVEEIGEAGFNYSIMDLCEPLDHTIKCEEEPVLGIKKEEECVDLTAESDEDEPPPKSSAPTMTCCKFETPMPEPGPSAWHGRLTTPLSSGLSYDRIDNEVKDILNSNNEDLAVDQFCESESSMTLEEILRRLDVPRLKELIKATKSKPTRSDKESMISALLLHSRTQSTLAFTAVSRPSRKGKARDDGFRQTTISFPKISRQTPMNGKKSIKSAEDRLREQALEKLGKCVRVNYNFYRLIRRMHIICFRATEHPTALLLPALLTSFKKRKYASYNHSRDGGIWSTREDLLLYEQALALEAKIEEFMELVDESAKGGGSTTKASRLTNFQTPMTPTPGKRLATPLRTPNSVRSTRYADTPGSMKEEPIESWQYPIEEPEVSSTKTPKEQKAEITKYLYLNYIRDRWQSSIAVKKELKERSPALERFEPGFVYTRLVCGAGGAFATLKEYTLELELVQSLLAQRFWRRGKRAAWYTRRAILQTRYLHKDLDGRIDLNVLQEALDGIYEALKDNDTGIVWRPGLVRRILRLEKSLKIPPEQCVKVEGKLHSSEIVELEAIRVHVHGMKLDPQGRPIIETPVRADASVRDYFSPIATRNPGKEVKEEPKLEKKRNGKTYWKGTDGAIVNVEERALQYYCSLGYKGFHSETSILTTIFGLLFWDIIFASIPGAFETEFQAAPLDIGEDTFYAARKELIDKRLAEIRDGNAVEILKKHDEMYREKETWCIGVKWDLCSREDLAEIVECLGGNSLAFISQLFCEDYVGRSSGVPDLIVWNAELKECKLVEVKGPGDKPMENQKLWFDSLLRAHVAVEICRVIDINCPNTAPKTTGKRKRKTPVPSSSKRRKVAQQDIDANDVEPEEDYDQLDAEEYELTQLPLEKMHAN